MTIRSRVEATQGADIVLLGDSLTSPGFDPYSYTRQLAILLTGKDPSANVILRTIEPNTGGLLMADIIIQPGSTPPSQIIRVMRDGKSGATAVERANNSTYVFNFPAHYAGLYLGVNDVGMHGQSGHTRDDFIDCLTALALRARNLAGAAQVVLTTPAWYESSLNDPRSAIRAAYAADTRMIGRRNNFGCIDMSKIMEDHYTDTGNAGQGDWFPSDNSHYGPVPHAIQAAEHMKQMGWV